MITLWDCNPALDNYSYQFSSVIYLLNKFNSKCQRYVKLRYGIRFCELMIIYFSSHLSSACMGSVLAYFFLVGSIHSVVSWDTFNVSGIVVYKRSQTSAQTGGTKKSVHSLVSHPVLKLQVVEAKRGQIEMDSSFVSCLSEKSSEILL